MAARLNRPADVDSLILYIDRGLDAALLNGLESTLAQSFPLKATDRVNLDICDMIEKSGRAAQCYSDERPGQIDAEQLLQLMLEMWLPVTQQRLEAATRGAYHPRQTAGMIITKHDCYTPELNFVFGVARAGMGACVSTHRLASDMEFIRKECIHECGHIFGLSHCKLPCVMTFSNGVDDADQKNSTLCSSCQLKISGSESSTDEPSTGEEVIDAEQSQRRRASRSNSNRASLGQSIDNAYQPTYIPLQSATLAHNNN